MGIGLQTDVSGGQDEGEGGEDDGVQAAYGGQQVGPSDAARAQRVLVRLVAHSLHALVGPSGWEAGAADYHADSWKSYDLINELFSLGWKKTDKVLDKIFTKLLYRSLCKSNI